MSPRFGRMQAGANVFTEGDPADVILTILSGRVRVTTSSAKSLDLPDVLEAGDPVGDVAAFEGGPYPASGTAVEPTECLVIPRAELFRTARRPAVVRPRLRSRTDSENRAADPGAAPKAVRPRPRSRRPITQ